ncbi:MAG TPA: four helix bundle protein [Chitinophagaceae bacterium]|nr:four helix bundle protein [Chitinophagaceae bacterium]
MRNFKELRIWQNGIDIAVNTYRFTETLPREDKFAIVQQMTRASVSIASNIAEGSAEPVKKIIHDLLNFPLVPVLNLKNS